MSGNFNFFSEMTSLDIVLTLVRGPGRLSALAPRSAQLLLVFNLPQIETALLQIETALLQIETALPQIETALLQIETALPQIETALLQIETALSQIRQQKWR